MKFATRDEMRQIDAIKKMAAVGLACHLRNLLRDIFDGKDVAENLVAFQQYVQFAPVEEKERLLELLEGK